MGKSFIKVAHMLMVLLLCVTSCLKDECNKQKGNVVFKLPQFDIVDKSCVDTRTKLNLDMNFTTWSVDREEKIGVFPVDNSNGIHLPFTIGTYGSGNMIDGQNAYCPTNSDWEMKNGTSYVAYYPYKANSLSGKYVSVNMLGKAILTQKQSGSVYIGDFDFIYSKRKKYNDGINFEMKRKYGLLRIILNNIPDKLWKKISVYTSDGSLNLAVSGMLDLVTGDYSEVTKSSSYVLYYGNGIKSQNLNIIFPLLKCSTGELVCEFASTDGVLYKFKLPSVDVCEGSYVKYSVKDMQDATVIVEKEYIDLGLPSGLKWATKNVGARTTVDSGDFFAWGEITPKDEYGFDNYKFYYNGLITKYRGTYDNSQRPDNRCNLESSDDAAYINWGVGWRMPTCNDVVELINNTTQNYIENFHDTGVSGFLLTSKNNGNELFFPIAVSANNHVYDGELDMDLYWTSNLYFDLATDGDRYAISYIESSKLHEQLSNETDNVNFQSFVINKLGDKRCKGKLVRAVYER